MVYLIHWEDLKHYYEDTFIEINCNKNNLLICFPSLSFSFLFNQFWTWAECASPPTYSVHLVAVYVYKWFYVANTVDGTWLDLWVNVLVNSIVIVPFMVIAFMKQDHYALDSIVDLPR